MNPKGRPQVPEKDQQRRRQISLDDSRLAKARKLGNGNASAGIRRALDAYAIKLIPKRDHFIVYTGLAAVAPRYSQFAAL